MVFQLPQTVNTVPQVYEDATSPGAEPLLNFLLKFGTEESDYLNAIKNIDSKLLWGIGHEVLKWPSNNTNDAGDDSVKDESTQIEDAYLKIIKGRGLPPVSSGLTVSRS